MSGLGLERAPDFVVRQHFRSIFSRDYQKEETSSAERNVFALFSSVQKDTLEKLQERLTSFRTRNSSNACLALGRARLLAGQLAVSGDVSEEAGYRQKEALLLSTLHSRLREAGIERVSFFRNLYSGRLKFQETKSTSHLSSLVKMALFLLPVAICEFAATRAVASNLVAVRPPNAHLNACIADPQLYQYQTHLDELNHDLSNWQLELERPGLNTSLSHYDSFLHKLTSFLPFHHYFSQKIVRDLDSLVHKAETVFSLFKTRAEESIRFLLKPWNWIRDRFVQKLKRGPECLRKAPLSRFRLLQSQNNQTSTSLTTRRFKSESLQDLEGARAISYLDSLNAIHERFKEDHFWMQMNVRSLCESPTQPSSPAFHAVYATKRMVNRNANALQELSRQVFPPNAALATFQNSFASMFLNEAIASGNVMLMHLLKFCGFDMAAPIEGGYPSLLNAIGAGNDVSLQALLDLGVNVETRSSSNYSAVAIAALRKNFRSMRFLARAGSNLNLPNVFAATSLEPSRSVLSFLLKERNANAIRHFKRVGGNVNGVDTLHRTALHIAAEKADIWAIDLLLRLGANPNLIEPTEQFTPLCQFKRFHSKLPPRTLVMRDRIYHKVITTKLFSHTWEMKGAMKIEGNWYNLEFGFSPMLSQEMFNIFRMFLGDISRVFSPREEKSIKSFLNKASSRQDPNTIQAAAQIKAGELVSIKMGYKGHTIQSFFFENFFVIADKALSRMPVEVYQFNPSAVTPANIQEMFALREKSYEEYKKWLDQFPGKFNSTLHPLTTKINRLYSSKKLQTIANCAWESVETALYALIAVMRDGNFASGAFQLWEQYAKVFSAERFVNEMGLQTLKANAAVLFNFLKILYKSAPWDWHPQLRARLEQVENHIFHLIGPFGRLVAQSKKVDHASSLP